VGLAKNGTIIAPHRKGTIQFLDTRRPTDQAAADKTAAVLYRTLEHFVRVPLVRRAI